MVLGEQPTRKIRSVLLPRLDSPSNKNARTNRAFLLLNIHLTSLVSTHGLVSRFQYGNYTRFLPVGQPLLEVFTAKSDTAGYLFRADVFILTLTRPCFPLFQNRQLIPPFFSIRAIDRLTRLRWRRYVVP